MVFSTDFVLGRPEEDPYDAYRQNHPGPEAPVSNDDVWRQMDRAIGRETPQNVHKMDLATFQREMM